MEHYSPIQHRWIKRLSKDLVLRAQGWRLSVVEQAAQWTFTLLPNHCATTDGVVCSILEIRLAVLIQLGQYIRTFSMWQCGSAKRVGSQVNGRLHSIGDQSQAYRAAARSLSFAENHQSIAGCIAYSQLCRLSYHILVCTMTGLNTQPTRAQCVLVT